MGALERLPRIAAAFSLRDPAGRGSARLFAELFGGERTECPEAVECYNVNGLLVGGYDEDSIHLEMLDLTPDPSADAIIVFSRHRSEAGRKSLTVHHPGNPTNSAELGGEPGVLAKSFPALSKALLLGLKAAAEETGLADTHEVTLEATHHGPTRPDKAIVFVELGSVEEDWVNPKGWEALAIAVKRALDSLESIMNSCRPATGFGGGHYPIKHTKLQLEDEGVCIGHVIPKYAFQQGLAPTSIIQAIEKSFPEPARMVYVEKKSLKATQRRLVEEAAISMSAEVVYI